MMKATRPQLIGVFCVVLMIIGAAWWFNPKPDDNGLSFNPVLRDSVFVYWSKNKGSEIVTDSVVRIPPKTAKTPEALLTFAINELLKGPSTEEEDKGYFSEIPEGTTLLGIKETASGLYINLSGEFASGGGSNSMLQRIKELAKTVISVPQQKPVYVQVEGKLLETLGGEGVMIHEPITDDPDLTR